MRAVLQKISKCLIGQSRLHDIYNTQPISLNSLYLPAFLFHFMLILVHLKQIFLFFFLNKKLKVAQQIFFTFFYSKYFIQQFIRQFSY